MTCARVDTRHRPRKGTFRGGARRDSNARRQASPRRRILARAVRALLARAPRGAHRPARRGDGMSTGGASASSTAAVDGMRGALNAHEAPVPESGRRRSLLRTGASRDGSDGTRTRDLRRDRPFGRFRDCSGGGGAASPEALPAAWRRRQRMFSAVCADSPPSRLPTRCPARARGRDAPSSSEPDDARPQPAREPGLIRSRALITGLLAAASLPLSACSLGDTAAGSDFKPKPPGTLTVATAFLPAPGFWTGNPPTHGFEAGLARALADRLGLDRVRVVQVPFAQIVSGELGGADLALSQLTPTKKRERRLDFSTAYLASPPGVLARGSVDASDVKGLRDLQWVISRVSTLTSVIESRIRPYLVPIETVDRAQALKVLRSGRADALMLDLPVALGLA